MEYEKNEKFNNFIYALFDACKNGDELIDLNENLQNKECIIVKQYILKKPKWVPGSPCKVTSLFSSDKCPKYSEGCACTDATCKFNEGNKQYFESLKKYEQAQQRHEIKRAAVKNAWKAFIRS